MRSPWTWVPSLFAAEEIPSAMVTFVALLMFLQTGSSATEATFLTSLIALPWIGSSFIRDWINKIGRFKQALNVLEGLLFLGLVAVALAFPYGKGWLFTALFNVSLLCSGHKVVVRTYYEQKLHPRLQRLFNGPRMFFSQAATVMTYGALIIAVGALEVYLRQIRPAWSMGCYILAGVFLLFVFYHMLVLQNPVNKNKRLREKVLTIKEEGHTASSNRSLSDIWRHIAILFLLLLPQSLMFHSRVLFLIDPTEKGGLGCTIQEIGFAQGTVGVIGFSLGIMLGLRLMKKFKAERLYWPLAITLGLSPLVYVCMTFFQPTNLGMLCLATSIAQLLFGVGLNVCRFHIQQISRGRYHNNIDLLHIPIITACMIIPMAISGLLVTHLGYRTYFLIDSISAPIAWFGVFLLSLKYRGKV